MLLLTALVSAAMAAQPQPDGGAGFGHRSATATLFISPMGEPFRGQPSREAALAQWFRRADTNGDGYLTASEMRADADRFFATLDVDHSGEIDPGEITRYENHVAPEIQVVPFARADSGGERGRGGRRGKQAQDLNPGLEGAGRYGLLNIPEPVASADADLNRGVSKAEFEQAAVDRLTMLDTNHDGRLTLAELAAQLPKVAPPQGGRGERGR